jgi:hypothetical protein
MPIQSPLSKGPPVINWIAACTWQRSRTPNTTIAQIALAILRTDGKLPPD